MANDIIITPVSASIQFSGSANASIKLTVDASGSLSITGNSGSLFSITDNLSGSLMSVNTIAGLPILEVFSDNRVNIGKYAAEAIKIQSGGSDVALGSGSVMFVTSSGRVGIGTTVPGVKLDVFGTARILTNAVPSVGSGMEFSYVGGGSPYGTIYSYNRDSPAYIDTVLGAGGNQLFLKASGNVGIGTSIPNTLLNVGSGTPSTAANGIQFGSDTSASLYRISTGVIKTDGGLTAAGNITIAKNGAYLYLNGTNGDAEILWQSNSSNKWAMGMNVGDATQNFNIYNYTTATTNLTVLSASGNVGIGTASPSFKLQVIGDIATYKNGSNSVASQLYIANAANTKGYNFQLNSAGTSLDLWGYDDGNGWKNNVTFAQGGNVGIGSTSPVNKLDVAGNISASSFTGSHFGTSSWATNSLTASSLVATNSYTITNLTASNINIGNSNSLSIGSSYQVHNIYLQKPLVASANYQTLHLGTRWYWDFTANVWTASSQPNADNPDWTAIDSFEYLSFKVGSVTGSVTSLTTSSYDSNERLRISLTDVRVVNSGSDAEFRIVENDSVNNPKLTFYNVATPKWVVGVDAADSDKFKINKGALLNTTNVITINTSNNVGIGTTSPVTKLQVAGTSGTAIISVNNTSLNRSSSFGIDNTGAYLQNSTNGDYFDFRNATGTANIRVTHNTNTYLNTTYTSVGSITNSGSKLSVFGNLSIGSTYGSTAAPTNGAIFEGNVGIGTTNPNTNLNVGSGTPSTAASGIQFGSDTSANLYRISTGVIKTDGGLTVTGTTNCAAISVNGSVNVYGASSGYIVSRRDTSANAWQWYSQTGELRLYDQINALDRLIVTTAGLFTFTSAISCSAITGSHFGTSSFAISASYAPGGSGLTGGTTNYIPLWTSATTQGISVISQSGTIIGLSGSLNVLQNVTASLFNGLNFIGGINTISSSTTTTVDLRYAVTQMQLSQSITTFAHSNATSGSATWMLATVGAGTAVTITWPTSYKWPGGVAPSLTTTSAKRDVYQFMSYDGSSTSTGYVFATVVAQNM